MSKIPSADFSATNRRPTYESRPPTPPLPLVRVLTYGLAAGAVGVATMTLVEKAEQLITGRPNSYVPGHTLRRLLGLAPRPDSEMWGLNMAMHWGQGIACAGVRGVMSAWGVRGPFADFMFMGVRLMTDQTLENVTGVGALPWTWPVNEQVVDLLHKFVFAFVTGYFCDRWIQ